MSGYFLAMVPFELERKTWTELQEHVLYCKSRSKKSGVRNWSHFRIRHAVDSPNARIYCLGPTAVGEQYSILYADIPVHCKEKELQELSLNPLFKHIQSGTVGRLTKEEELLRERMRSSICFGISDYSFNPTCGLLLFSSSSALFVCDDSMMKKSATAEQISLPENLGGAPLDPQLCANESKLIAFVCHNDIYIQYGDIFRRATFTQSKEKQRKTAGSPSFIIQEEFDRYSALWWSPVSPPGSEQNRHLLMFEEVDESKVVLLDMSAPATIVDESDKMPYPLPGTENAKSTVKLLDIRISNEKTSFEVVELSLLANLSDWFPWFEYLLRAGWMPDGRAVWLQLMSRTQDKIALVHIPIELFTDRYASMRDLSGISPTVTCLYEETNEMWINYHDICYFFKSELEPDFISFIWSSERTGYSHLYLSSCQLPVELSTHDDSTKAQFAINHKQTALTSGDWAVAKKSGVTVDESRGLIYFVGFKDTPLESHIYVTSYIRPDVVERLTELGQTHCSCRSDPILRLDVNVGFVCWRSSLSQSPTCVFYSLIHSQTQNQALPTAVAVWKFSMDPFSVVFDVDNMDVEYADEESISSFDFNENGGSVEVGTQEVITTESESLVELDTEPEQYPELLSFVSSTSGYTHYALLMKPINCNANTQYPVLHYVYGGPELQLVRNSWTNWVGFHKYTSLGYAIVMIDGRGSNNRGLNFEAMIKHKMGTIEVEDQVEGLFAINEQTGGLLDLERVAISGWSYGGYVSLMALAQRPDIFKLAIAGGPVTSWDLYDTGYTERYMGLPDHNLDVYKRASVIAQATKFPDEPGRILLLHGLIDENVHFKHTEKLIDALIQAGKPYQLQIFPRERHGVRCSKANENMDTTVLNFMQEMFCNR